MAAARRSAATPGAGIPAAARFGQVPPVLSEDLRDDPARGPGASVSARVLARPSWRDRPGATVLARPSWRDRLGATVLARPSWRDDVGPAASSGGSAPGLSFVSESCHPELPRQPPNAVARAANSRGQRVLASGDTGSSYNEECGSFSEGPDRRPGDKKKQRPGWRGGNTQAAVRTKRQQT
jgi:hypothetical protein